jgi:hypothetical protein
MRLVSLECASFQSGIEKLASNGKKSKERRVVTIEERISEILPRLGRVRSLQSRFQRSINGSSRNVNIPLETKEPRV